MLHITGMCVRCNRNNESADTGVHYSGETASTVAEVITPLVPITNDGLHTVF